MKKNLSTKKNIKTSNRQYGLLSMISMVIGIVIGSGIFVKNQSLIMINNNILISIMAWIIGSLIVLSLIIAFMELFNRVEKNNEQVTLLNIGRIVVGEKFGRIIGLYFAYVNIPSTIAVFGLFGAGEIMNVIPIEMLVWQEYLVRIGITLFLFIIFFTMNGLFSRPGRIFQNIGTLIKLIPLTFIILLLISCFITSSLNNKDILNSFHHNQEIINNNQGIHNSNLGSHWLNGIKLFVISMPSIMFVYDGFLISGSLSKKAKTKSTYSKAVLIGIILTIIIYFLFSVSIFLLGEAIPLNSDPNSSNYNPYLYGTIQNVIYSVFRGTGAEQIITIIITITIVISMITAISGTIIGSTSAISDLSANNLIKDKKGKLLKQNKNFALPGATWMVLWIGLFYFALMIFLDVIAVPTEAWKLTYNEAWRTTNFVGLDYGTSYFSSIASLGAFLSFVILLIFSLISRKKNPPEKKYKSFIPSSIFSILLMILIIIIYMIQLFIPSDHKRLEVVNIISILLTILLTLISYWLTNWNLRNFPKEEREKKEPLIHDYKKN